MTKTYKNSKSVTEYKGYDIVEIENNVGSCFYFYINGKVESWTEESLEDGKIFVDRMVARNK